MNSGLYKKI